MTRLRIVRSNGVWGFKREEDPEIHGAFKTLEKAQASLEDYIQKLEIVPPKKQKTRKSR